MPKYRVLHPIIPGTKTGEGQNPWVQMEDPIPPGGTIELSEEEAEYPLQEGIIETDEAFAARKAESAEEKMARAKALQEEADRLQKEAQETKNSKPGRKKAQAENSDQEQK